MKSWFSRNRYSVGSKLSENSCNSDPSEYSDNSDDSEYSELFQSFKQFKLSEQSDRFRIVRIVETIQAIATLLTIPVSARLTYIYNGRIWEVWGFMELVVSGKMVKSGKFPHTKHDIENQMQ